MFTKRQMLLLQLLEEQVDWITSSELGRLSGFSNKTVQTDLHRLVDFLPPNWNIERVRGKGLKLMKPLAERVTSALDTMNHEQFEYEIIQKITTGQVTTIEALSKQIYLNTSSLHVVLKDLDKQLLKYDLTLSRNPLQLVGDESLIRYYLLQLNKEVFGESRMFYTSSRDYEQRVKAFKQLENKLGIILYPLPLINMVLYIEIAVTRIKAGFPATIDEHFKKVVMQNPSYHKTADFLDSVEKENAIAIDNDERVLLFLALIHSDFTYVEIIEQPTETIRQLQDHPLLLDFISLLGNRLNLPLLDNADFLLAIYDFYKKMRLRYAMTQELFAAKRESSLLIEELYGDTTVQLEAFCAEWMEAQNYVPLTSDAISELTLLVEKAKLEMGYYQKRVLLISTETYNLRQFTQTLLEKKFSGQIKILCEDTSAICSELIQHLQIDFVIADTPFDDLGAKVVLINRIPTPKDLANIEHVLHAE